MKPIFIIAEAGVNHNGDEDLAYKLVEIAHAAGADAVKFQTFKAKCSITVDAKQCDYQITNTKKIESQLDMVSRLELSYAAHHKLVAYCNELGIEFLSTAFDSESLAFLVNDLKLKTLKIASGEITNAPLVLEHARTGCNLIISTGMATLADIEAVLGVVAFGYTMPHVTKPSMDAFQAAYYSEAGKQSLKQKVTLLHCTTEYPAPLEDINLLAMDTMANAFHLPVGYSDHSEGILVPVAAAARGAVIIEKHFTLDKNMAGPDHKASLNPDELSKMCAAIRATEHALGDGIKGPRPSELKNKAIARKSLVAAIAIQVGEPFTAENLEIKRPGHGTSPYQYWELQAKLATRNYKRDEVIDENTMAGIG